MKENASIVIFLLVLCGLLGVGFYYIADAAHQGEIAGERRDERITAFVASQGFESPHLDGYWSLSRNTVPPTGCVGRNLMFSAVVTKDGKQRDVEGCCNDDGTVCRMITVQR